MGALRLIDMYKTDLKENILPFWEKAIDKKHGGVYTCFTNKGDKKISNRKYIWSQGRFLWLCCNLLKDKIIPDDKFVIWSRAAEQTYWLLKENAVMQNNHIVFAVERDGIKISDQMDISIFADCFYVLGCNAYSLYKKDKDLFDEILIIYRLIKDRIVKNDFKSEPYPVGSYFRAHSIPMILLNICQELYDTAKAFNHIACQELYHDIQCNIKIIMSDFVVNEQIIELIPLNNKFKNTLLARHVNPGHVLECIWFMFHGIHKLDAGQQKYNMKSLANLAERALQLGWDEQYGGILRFVDKNGGKPNGEKLHTNLEKLILETWNLKLWWPHSEALYTTLLFAKVTDNRKWKEWYKKIEKYVFATFPNRDKGIGEWIQIRDQTGKPIDKIVALPVKDPFHIIRNYLLIINLLECGKKVV